MSNLHTLIKPIIYIINEEKDQSNNILGYDEIILLAHDDDIVHYMGVSRRNGVFDHQEYCQADPEEFWNTVMGAEYSCQGFIDLEKENAAYLYGIL
tara:strand:- start:90 stop:377 length:288 start_codon:yes stop_codon:yes gene_type:complete